MSKLYVGNISYQATDDGLSQMFSQFGTVNSCKIIMDHQTGKSKGFAFVEMASEEEANSAIDALNNTEIDGRTIKVNVALEKKRYERY